MWRLNYTTKKIKAMLEEEEGIVVNKTSLCLLHDKRYMLSCRLPHPLASQEAKATVDE